MGNQRGDIAIRGILIVGANVQRNKLLARDAFISKYCAERGWDRENLSMNQLLEIRKQPGWINAGESSENV